MCQSSGYPASQVSTLQGSSQSLVHHLMELQEAIEGEREESLGGLGQGQGRSKGHSQGHGRRKLLLLLY